jgi:protein-S-isoprenylcysteine O-methyltransferase Ste14
LSDPPPSLLERWGAFLFRTRDVVFPAVILALVLITEPYYIFGSHEGDFWLDALGILVALTGQSLRVAVIGYRYIARGGRNRRVHADDLVTGGLFQLARNPLYVGNILVLFGLFLIWNAPLLYAVAVPFTLIGYRSIVATEEAFLRRKFGDAYEEYCRETNRWIPDLWRFRRAVEGIPFNWKRVLLKEYGSWTAWIGTACALMIVESLRHGTYESHATIINTLAAAIALVLLAWAVTRWLKLSRRITADA